MVQVTIDPDYPNIGAYLCELCFLEVTLLPPARKEYPSERIDSS
jgi:hypothetical protein